MSWQEFVDGYLLNYFPTNDEPDESQAINNACVGAAIIDGSTKQICAIGGNLKLLNGKVDQTQEDGSTKQIDLNEINNLIAVQSDYSKTPNGGVRINGVKHTVVGHNANFKSVYLKRQGGGATIAKSETLYLLATWDAAAKCELSTGEKVLQTPQLCNKCVEDLQKYLSDQGQ